MSTRGVTLSSSNIRKGLTWYSHCATIRANHTILVFPLLLFSRIWLRKETDMMLKHRLSFNTKKRRLLAGTGIGLTAMVLGVATARIFVHFAQPQLNPGPLWVPFVVRIPLGLFLAWGTYRLLTIQAESYWHRMTTQDAVRNACQMLLNAAQVHESPQARV